MEGIFGSDRECCGHCKKRSDEMRGLTALDIMGQPSQKAAICAAETASLLL